MAPRTTNYKLTKALLASNLAEPNELIVIAEYACKVLDWCREKNSLEHRHLAEDHPSTCAALYLQKHHGWSLRRLGKAAGINCWTLSERMKRYNRRLGCPDEVDGGKEAAIEILREQRCSLKPPVPPSRPAKNGG